MQQQRRARHIFLVVWAALVMLRLWLAARLPLFVDEAFYWQESQHLAWAYSDLPGLTAWLIRLGTGLAGDSLLGVRWPFLLLAALLPWLAVRTAWSLGPVRAWQAGALVAVFPLTGLLGILALPDVPMNLAAMACLLGGLRMLRAPDWRAWAWLAAGLMLGALSHYRFLGVPAVGVVALLALPQGRRALREPGLWLALALGVLAWLPLLLWNLDHGDAGWRFQLLDRHPWRPQWEGLWFPLIQALLVTPLLLLAMLQAAGRVGARHALAVRWFALCGGMTVLGFFALGFVADTQRVSFHWPLPGYLALALLVPQVLSGWRPVWRRACLVLLGLGLLAGAGAAAWVAQPQGRAALAGSGYYPDNFSGWDELAAAVRAQRAELPAGARIVADHFKLGAELGFALGEPDIAVLEHPLNARHGRARQLELWGLTGAATDPGSWRLLVVGASDVKLGARLAHYQSLCERLGALPAASPVEIDQGARRFLLFALPPGRAEGACVTPALAHLDLPHNGARVERRFSLRGWAVKDGAGLRKVTVLLDGAPLVVADYGQQDDWVGQFLAGRSRDPNLPRVRFQAEIDLPDAVSAGRHALGLELEAGDGSRERWSGHWIRVPAVAEP